jgi:hypothetical protein
MNMARMHLCAGIAFAALSLPAAAQQKAELVPAQPFKFRVAQSQQSESSSSEKPQKVRLAAKIAVPREIEFAGTLRDRDGDPLGGIVGVTFAIYKAREGGAPVWLETENIKADKKGHYAVVVGAPKGKGQPLDALFPKGEQRWLGAQVLLPGEVEMPRQLVWGAPTWPTKDNQPNPADSRASNGNPPRTRDADTPDSRRRARHRGIHSGHFPH